jgi:hypothetical protein
VIHNDGTCVTCLAKWTENRAEYMFYFELIYRAHLYITQIYTCKHSERVEMSRHRSYYDTISLNHMMSYKKVCT